MKVVDFQRFFAYNETREAMLYTKNKRLHKVHLVKASIMFAHDLLHFRVGSKRLVRSLQTFSQLLPAVLPSFMP